MAATNLESFEFDNLETGRFPSHQDTRVLVSGQNLTRSTLLAKITASGKFTQWDSGGAGGIEIPNAILSRDADASAGDAACLIYTFGEFDENALTLMSGDALTNALRETLRDAGIYLVKGQNAVQGV